MQSLYVFTAAASCAAVLLACGSAGISHDDRYPAAAAGDYGYIDSSGALKIPHGFDAAHAFNEGRAGVQRNGLWGFVDVSGALVIKPQYEAVAGFREGLAPVRKDGKVGFVDATGALAIAPKFDGAERFSEGLALVKNAGLYGFIDRTGAVVIPVTLKWASSFSEGLAAASKSGSKAGFIDATGAFAISESFAKVGAFNDGLAAAQRPGQTGFSYIDTDGAVVVEGPFESAADFSDGRAIVKRLGRYGVIDTDGSEIREPFAAGAGRFASGLAPVRAQSDARVSFLNRAGETAFDATFDDTHGYDGALAAVRDGLLWGYVDRSGATVWTQPYGVPAAAVAAFDTVANKSVGTSSFGFAPMKTVLSRALAGVFASEYAAVCAARAHAGAEIVVPRSVDGRWYWGVFGVDEAAVHRPRGLVFKKWVEAVTVVEKDATTESGFKEAMDTIAACRQADQAIAAHLAKPGLTQAQKDQVPRVRRYGTRAAALPPVKKSEDVHLFRP